MTPEALEAINKVEKLLALARGNANENEAAVATEKAMQILAKYNLDMAVLSARKPADNARKDQTKGGGLYTWQRDLWKAVGALNMCVYFSIKGLARGQKYENRLVGSPVNVLAATIMAEYLQDTIERLAKQYAGEMGYRSVFVREMIAYREGMTARIVVKLQEERARRDEEDKRKREEETARQRHPGYASTGTALVLADVADNEADFNNDYINGWPLGTTAQHRRDQKAREAAWKAEQERKLAERDAAEAADPSLKEKRLAEEAKTKAANDEYWGKMYAKWAKQDARRGSSTPRARALTEGEKRATLSTYRDGYADGNSVGIDQQVDENKRKSLS